MKENNQYRIFNIYIDSYIYLPCQDGNLGEAYQEEDGNPLVAYLEEDGILVGAYLVGAYLEAYLVEAYQA